MLKYLITSFPPSYLVLYTRVISVLFFSFQVKFILLKDDSLLYSFDDTFTGSKKRESNLLLRDNRRWEIGGRLINWRRAITVIYRGGGGKSTDAERRTGYLAC